MPPITVMIKLASGLCNMRCKYCFYADEAANRAQASYGLMSEATLEAVLRQVLRYATGNCTIAFQGGEPTRAGLPFFQRAIELETQYNVNHCHIENALQTNGYLMDDAWAAFFAQHHFLVGVSLDGPQEIHDANRVDAGGNGTYARVIKAIHLLQSHEVEFNVLTVVTSAAARSIRKIYHFYGRNQLFYQQYIPCLDPLGEARGQQPWSLTPEMFERYLKNLFDCWYEDAAKNQKRYHRYFENLMMMIAGQRPEACGMSGVCERQYVVEADGSVFPCDFYMLDAWKLGSFVTQSVEEIDAKRKELQFIELSATPHPDCLACKWGALCRGGCRRDREPFEQGALSKNYFCKAYYNFFEYAYPRLLQIVRRYSAQ